MSVLEAVAVVLVLLLAAVLIISHLPDTRDHATVNAVVRIGGSEVRCTTGGSLAAMLAFLIAGVLAVTLLTR